MKFHTGRNTLKDIDCFIANRPAGLAHMPTNSPCFLHAWYALIELWSTYHFYCVSNLPRKDHRQKLENSALTKNGNFELFQYLNLMKELFI